MASDVLFLRAYKTFVCFVLRFPWQIVDSEIEANKADAGGGIYSERLVSRL
jgi:hypothetical protein